MEGVGRDGVSIRDGGEDVASHAVESGCYFAVPCCEIGWEVVEVLCEDVRCKEMRELVLGTGSVKLEDRLIVVELAEECVTVCNGLVEDLLDELFAKGGGSDGGAQDANAVC